MTLVYPDMIFRLVEDWAGEIGGVFKDKCENVVLRVDCNVLFRFDSLLITGVIVGEDWSTPYGSLIVKLNNPLSKQPVESVAEPYKTHGGDSMSIDNSRGWSLDA